MAKINNKEKLKLEHENKLIELYNTYYVKALEGDNQSLKPFLDCSKELFKDSEESEIMSILKGVKLDG